MGINSRKPAQLKMLELENVWVMEEVMFLSKSKFVANIINEVVKGH